MYEYELTRANWADAQTSSLYIYNSKSLFIYIYVCVCLHLLWERRILQREKVDPQLLGLC